MKSVVLGLAAVLTLSSVAFAIDPASVPEQKRTKLGEYLTAQEAAAFVTEHQPKVLFLDVRTPSEESFLGMPSMADANVPYMIQPEFPEWDKAKDNFKLEGNPDFIPEVRRRLSAKGLGQNDPIVLICRSGDRSAAATNLLSEAGFKNVYSVIDGYEGDLSKDGPKVGQRAVNGWKNTGLPWTYQLEKEKMYKLDK
jgi:rhodanese-related sulfurtransferase